MSFHINQIMAECDCENRSECYEKNKCIAADNEYSDKFMRDLRLFMKSVREQYGEDVFTQERMYKMLDSFDTELKYQVMEDFVTGNNAENVCIRTTRSTNKKRIVAIKYIRQATGLGLKEAKQVTDDADDGIGVISGIWDMHVIDELSKNLQDTGYEVI